MGLSDWPVVRQFVDRDVRGLGASARSARTDRLTARTEEADHVVRSVCPYCAVGCGQLVYVSDGRITDIEGDPDSPISRGCLCPKGAATFQLVTGDHRRHQVLYRRPSGTDVGDDPARAGHGHGRRAGASGPRRDTGRTATRTASRCDARWRIAHLGGATLDNEENYLIKKLFTALGIDPDREPGAYMTLLHGPRSGDLVRSRRRDHVPAGPAEHATASSSRARTWPSAIRSASGG